MSESTQKPRVLNKYKCSPEEQQEGVYIGRPSRWGNPFALKSSLTRNEVCDRFEKYVEENPLLIKAIKEELKGKNLICFCAPLRCHGDTLLRIANE
jgi:hypothetical protein